ncbi:ligase-associated DNA damage response endonuclease PdeM [Formosa sp. PL04]|uniref:ligase-associated DNA damage response endonuclease PdeM n=1 Tax=Formosa sp. PL04 TaxID=3081755 RepID=UPI002980D195|nr:ligase-associated DNA damage response endonuclease PdeM [Formosa sp. PL04]MDW5290322.1 ligase-associated DNA damage response endonuclease PdeM [Formosa sp. PL04]
MKTLQINCNNQPFILHPSGAAFWEEKGILLIADVHLGKIMHFRKHGSAVPQSSMYQNFDRLNKVVDYFETKIVCFLGDLFHSHINTEWLLFQDWIYNLNCKVVLVSGNHDIIATEFYNKLNVTVIQEWKIDDFLLTHHPEERKGYYNFSGHIHPGVQLRGLGKQRLKLSCFYKREHQMIFPAFGNFTGNYIVKPTTNESVFVTTKDEVLEIPIDRES